MIIRCWGARGSIPVSGKDYLRYGGNTTCLEIRNNRDDILLVDAGSGIREAGNAFLADGRRDFTLLLTHAHWDHIMGFPFFKPLYRHDATPIKYDDIHANVTYAEICIETYHLGDLTITPIALSHPNQGTGYKFSEAGKSFVFLTDNELGLQHEGGLSYDNYIEFCRGADLLIHDAEYLDEEYPKRRGWGHSTIEQATSLALDAGVKQLGLFHHNQERIDTEVDNLVALSRRIIRERKSSLECFAVHQAMELKP